MKNYRIAIASDHAGIYLKSKVIQFLEPKAQQILDFGTNSEEPVDYPDYAHKVIEAIVEESVDYGILICGSGIGMSIAANRSSQVRAALCINEYMAQKSRMHNNANVLVLSSKIIEDSASLNIVDVFFDTQFEGGRHSRRLAKIK